MQILIAFFFVFINKICEKKGGCEVMSEIHDIQQTTHALRLYCPMDSNYFPTPWRVIIGFLVMAGMIIALGVYAKYILFSSIMFICILITCFNFFGFFVFQKWQKDVPFLQDDELPTYSVFLPLLREANMVPQLMRAMDRIDYPYDKIECIYIIEENDDDTRLAVEKIIDKAQKRSRILIVPDGTPCTKPRACNYALWNTQGDICVIYDAEDIPDPLQLREAATRFSILDEDYACLQAPLDIHCPSYSILSSHMAIEYLYLFNCTLPALSYFRLPIPLGGTSNHLRREVLHKIYGWDSWNVTEDADLGIRLAANGYKTGMVKRKTIESATYGLQNFIRQRTRWQKGYLQTWMVRCRDMRGLINKLGFVEFMSFHFIIGVRSLISLVHVYVMLQLVFSPMLFFAFSDYSGLRIEMFIAYALLILSYVIVCVKKKKKNFIPDILMLPLVWCCLIIVVIRAIIQLIIIPTKWEKTEHTVLDNAVFEQHDTFYKG